MLDRDGMPIPDAKVSFKHFSQRSNGHLLLEKTSGQHSTNHLGLIELYFQRIGHKAQISISKPGYRDLQIALEMQFRRYQEQRSLTLSTRETPNLTTSYLPAFNPLPITLTLPPSDETPDPNIKRLSFRGIHDSSPLPERYLDIETGILTRELTEASDLELEITGNYSETTLHVTGLRGLLLKPVDLIGPGAGVLVIWRAVAHIDIPPLLE